MRRAGTDRGRSESPSSAVARRRQYESAEITSPRPGRQGPPGGRVDRALEELDRAVGEEEVGAAGVAAPVVLDVGLGVVDRPGAVLQPGRAEDLGPAFLGRGVELVGPPLDRRGLAEPAVDRAGRPGDVAEVVAPLADGDRVAGAVGDRRRSRPGCSGRRSRRAGRAGRQPVVIGRLDGPGLGADLADARTSRRSCPGRGCRRCSSAEKLPGLAGSGGSAKTGIDRRARSRTGRGRRSATVRLPCCSAAKATERLKLIEL